MFQGWILHGGLIHALAVFRVITMIANLILAGFCFRYLRYLKLNASLSERKARVYLTWGLISYSVAVAYGLMVRVVHTDATLRPGAILTLVGAVVACIGMTKLLSWKAV